MRIGIVGSGAVGGTLGKLWAAAGHEVMFGSRHPALLAGLVSETAGSAAGTPGEAAAFGEALLLAVNYATVDEAVATIRDAARGKVVIDATNPLVTRPDGGTRRAIGEDALALATMAVKLPGARLVKAFTTMWTGYLEQHAHRAGRPAAVALASDDEGAKAVAMRLVRDAGFEPVDLGGVADSRPLDPPSPIWNKVLTAAEIRDRLAHEAAPHAEASS